ncbi:phosphoglycerate mutase family protein [Chryseobacterium sp. Alg-005]|uniref:phosphoglycerate mutase family protein n=1 Tax=Chryseobacterium sp. Alg-005 TaxID=3159516 RepID=UPI003555A23D
MKKLLFTFSLLFFCLFTQAQTTQVYIVRHAEKDLSDKGNTNPNLSEAGKQRAEKLLAELKKIQFSAAYSTPFNRTQQTLEPLALFNKIGITDYDPRNIKGFVEEILSNHSGENIIIVGHSNTVLETVEAFGAKKPFASIAEDDYANLFHLTIEKDKVTLQSSKY